MKKIQEQIDKRIKDTEKFLKENCPEVGEEQKHLDNGIERNYWHYGYLVAMKDVLRWINKQSC